MVLLQWLHYVKKAMSRLNVIGLGQKAQGRMSLTYWAIIGSVILFVGMLLTVATAQPSQAQTALPDAEHLVWQLPGDREAYRSTADKDDAKANDPLATLWASLDPETCAAIDAENDVLIAAAVEAMRARPMVAASTALERVYAGG